ncbi:MAG: exosortase/archaeosortase family protein [Phycisphaerales bacterium]|nr:exosortase/archaeosortase family protein [Phycisphaerales bacterium]
MPPATVLPADTWRIDFGRPSQIKAALLIVGFVATFWTQLAFIPPLGSLVHAWLYESDWSHGPLIPLFSAYLVYACWDQLRRCPIRLPWVGLPIMVLGLGVYAWSLSGTLQFGYARPLSMMITLLGMIILLCGLRAMYYLWLPWLYLFFAIPLPQRIYFALTDPLRRAAAEVATAVMGLFPGVHIERVGSVIEYVYRGQSGQLGVVDACSGMRSTITLCAIGVAVAFMAERPLWQRLVLVAACIPIATFCNFIRVSVTSYLYIFVDPKYASGQYHAMFGMAVMLLAFGVFSGLAWLLGHLVVEDDAAGDDARGPAKA